MNSPYQNYASQISDRRRWLAGAAACLFTLFTLIASAPHHHAAKLRTGDVVGFSQGITTLDCALCDWLALPGLPAPLPVVLAVFLVTTLILREPKTFRAHSRRAIFRTSRAPPAA